MANARIIIYCLTLFLCPFQATSQIIDFRTVGVEKGLPSNEVYNVYQDRSGYIWAFTEYGIVRHNGVKFIPVCTNIPFSESAIYKVTETQAGDLLLINSNARIYRVVKDKAIPVRGMEALSAEIASHDETILDVVDNGKGGYYISTHSGSYLFHTKTRKVEQIAKNLPANEVNFRMIGNQFFIQRSMVENRPGQQLKLTAADGRLIHQFPVEISSQGRYAIRRSGKDLYLLSRNKIMLLKPDGSVQNKEFDNSILNIELDLKGHLWVAMAYDGLYELDARLSVLNHYLDGLPVSDVLFDNQSGMWVSTIGNGIFHCDNIHRKSWNHLPGLSGCISLLKVSNGKLFIGTAGGDLYSVQNNTLKKAKLETHKSYINDILFLGNRYYVGTKSSIFETDAQFGKMLQAPVNHGGYAFAEGPDQSLFVVSASLLFRKFRNSHSYEALVRMAKPRHVVKRSDTDYFISVRQGVYLWKGSLTVPDYLGELRGKNVASLSMDSRKNVWICTKGDGLYMLSPGNRLTHYDRLPSRVVSGICFERNGSVLLSTNKGVYINTTGNLEKSGAWQLILEGECTGLELFGGKLFIATRHGLSVINRNEIFAVAGYKFYFSSFLVNGKHFRKRGIHLTREQNDLLFQFDLLNYRFPERQLVYRLKGPSRGKGTVNGTDLHLQHLEPGYYELRVTPVINSMTRHRQAIVIPFYVAPAFYETRLFRLSTVVLLVVLIVLVTSLVFLRVRKKEAQRRKVNQLLAKYRLTALKAQVNPHFISNVLSAIQLMMLSGNTDKAGQYIARFSLLIRNLLNYSDKAVASLESELKIIDLTVELEQLRFADRFEFRKAISPGLNLPKLFIPPLITQPFIENAIWHGLLPLKGKRTPLLLLEAVAENGDLVISITDNGVGRSAAPPAKKAMDPSHKSSRGTALMQHRMETLNMLHATTGAAIYIDDLQDENGDPAGTRVRIVFPSEILNKLLNEHNNERYY